MKKAVGIFILYFVTIYGVVYAEEKSGDNKMLKGALVGAGTNVVGGAALDYVTGSGQPQPQTQIQYQQVQGPDGQYYMQPVQTTVYPPAEDPNKTVLKRALTGAVTGAVAAKMAGDDSSDKSQKSDGGGSGVSDTIADMLTGSPDSDEGGDWKHKEKHKGKPEGWRPPGWDHGNKTGWGDSDTPPGLDGSGNFKAKGKEKKK